MFVSGTTGFDYATMTISDDVAEQTEQVLRNIAGALEQAGASLDDVVRVRYLLPSADDFEACWPALRRAFGGRPAGRDDAGLRARRRAHEDRDRGHARAPT